MLEMKSVEEGKKNIESAFDNSGRAERRDFQDIFAAQVDSRWLRVTDQEKWRMVVRLS